MTKSTMMARFDDVVTDRRLTRARVEAHLAATRDEPGHLLDEYMVLASGGSSGERGIFVYGWDAAVDYMLGLSRSALARFAASGPPTASGIPLAMVAAGSGVHATRALAAIFVGAPIDVHSIPVTLPLAEIVARLNALQPLLLQSYASSLAMLAEEQRAGRLRIHPMSVTSTSEFFAPELRARVEAAFGVPAIDQLGSSEGILGTSVPGEPAIPILSDNTGDYPSDDEAFFGLYDGIVRIGGGEIDPAVLFLEILDRPFAIDIGCDYITVTGGCVFFYDDDVSIIDPFSAHRLSSDGQ